MEIRKAARSRVVRSRISYLDEPACVKNHQEAVAEELAKVQITSDSFHSTTAGRFYPDRMKLKGMFQPSDP